MNETGDARLDQSCPYCGLVAPDGWDGCRAIKTEVALWEANNRVSGGLARLGHDTYCVQHEERYCGRAKGLIAHLGGVCIGLEFAGHPNVYRALHRWLDAGYWRGVAYPPEPGVPSARGDVTVGDVHRATRESPEAYRQAVERWAIATWDAYRPLRDLARAWVASALATRSYQPR